MRGRIRFWRAAFIRGWGKMLNVKSHIEFLAFLLTPVLALLGLSLGFGYWWVALLIPAAVFAILIGEGAYLEATEGMPQVQDQQQLDEIVASLRSRGLMSALRDHADELTNDGIPTPVMPANAQLDQLIALLRQEGAVNDNERVTEDGEQLTDARLNQRGLAVVSKSRKLNWQ